MSLLQNVSFDYYVLLTTIFSLGKEHFRLISIIECTEYRLNELIYTYQFCSIFAASKRCHRDGPISRHRFNVRHCYAIKFHTAGEKSTVDDFLGTH